MTYHTILLFPIFWGASFVLLKPEYTSLRVNLEYRPKWFPNGSTAVNIIYVKLMTLQMLGHSLLVLSNLYF